MSDIKEELLAFFSKSWAWFLYILIGVIGKVSYDILYGKKLSWPQVIASIGLGLFAGFMACVICMNNGWEKHIPYIAPMATLLSEKIFVALFSLDYKQIITDLVSLMNRKK